MENLGEAEDTEEGKLQRGGGDGVEVPLRD